MVKDQIKIQGKERQEEEQYKEQVSQEENHRAGKETRAASVQIEDTDEGD